MEKAVKWKVKNLLPVAVSMAAGGLCLPAALGGLASELFKNFSDANLKIPITEEMFKGKLEELCKGEGNLVEYLQDILEEANERVDPKDIKLVIQKVMAPVISEMMTMLEIIREEKTDLRELLVGWFKDQSQINQDGYSLTHEQLSDIQNEMLNKFQKIDLKQTQILENIYESQSIMQSEFVNFKRELSELIQAVFGQSVQTVYNVDTMFDLATVHFNQQDLASRFDQPYNPDLYVRPELFFGSITEYLNDFKDPMQKNVPIFLLLAHLGMGKTWNFAYITEYLLIKRNMVIPFFINLKNGLQQQLYAIFKTQNMGEIVDRCQKIKDECQLPIFLILDGMHELIASELRDVLLILKDLLNKRTDALCVALSCRIIAWVQDQQIRTERSFFEEHIWSHQLCKDWQSQFDIATPISCILGEFSDIELDGAIDRYGLKKQNFSVGLYKICHQPYILRLVSEFIGSRNFYPSPEDPQSMKSLFYSDDLDAEKNTIMYRMGIQGNIMELFYLIIKAFPSANSELPADKFKEFANNPNFRPILYSGLILKERHKWRYVYKINPVYVPLLSQFQEFSHLLKEEVIEYKGTEIIKSEMDMLMSLEQELGEFSIVSLIEWNTFGVKIADNHVVGIGLYGNGREFSSLPTVIERLTTFKELKTLNLEDNELTAIPKSIELLTSLTSLDLGYNKLTSLPDSIDQLTELKELNLRNNKFISLPDSIGRLKSLTKLNLKKNQLTSLPNNIGELTALTKLNLNRNILSSLPDTIGQLTALTKLELKKNQLTSLPNSIGELTSLTDLDLRNNQVTSLPDTIGQLSALKKLNIGDNLLTTLPDSIGELTALIELDLRYNRIISLPESIEELTSLTDLDLRFNRQSFLENEKMPLIKLKNQGCEIIGYDI